MLLAPSAAFGQGLATVTPTRFDDPAAGPVGCLPNVNCSLRQALEAVSPGGTVNLLTGRYELSQATSLAVKPGVTINGAGARATTIDGNSLTRVLLIQESNEIATINDVTITGGTTTGNDFQGGGIYVLNNAGLALNRSAVVGNSATQEGGGIYSGSNNAVQIADSTISGNTVGTSGAGGGIAGSSTSDLRIFNSTISGNTAPGVRSSAGLATNGALEMVHVTMAANQSATTTLSVGLIVGVPTPALNISNTIIASDSGPACEITPGRTNSGTNNLGDDTTCNFGTVANPLLGALQDNNGPTNTHALAAGSPAIDTAAPALCRSVDQRGTTRPQLGGCDIGAFEYVPPPPPPEDPPQGSQELPPPVAGRNVNALPESGTVRVKLPGRRKYRRLTEGEQLPVGTTFDTRRGHVTLVVAADKRGGTSTAEFWAGIFKLSQTKKAKPITTLKLVEKLRCKTARTATIAAKRKKKRRLWGNGNGRFRTDGQYSSATVRGTKWLVEDRCTSTLTRVVRGRVAVRDKVKRKTVIVRAKKRYIARKSVQSR